MDMKLEGLTFERLWTLAAVEMPVGEGTPANISALSLNLNRERPKSPVGETSFNLLLFTPE